MQSEIYHNIIQNRHPVSVWTKTPMHVPCPAKVLEYPGRVEDQEKKTSLGLPLKAKRLSSFLLSLLCTMSPHAM